MELDFEKMNGLIPAIIQDNYTQKVLMLGFMNKEAYEKTMETGKVTFFSRTKNRLWTKGEESGNFLHVVSVKADCDNDTLLIMVHPEGPVCHKGYLLGRQKRAGHHVPERVTGFHRPSPSGNAGEIVHHQPVQFRSQQDGTKGR